MPGTPELNPTAVQDWIAVVLATCEPQIQRRGLTPAQAVASIVECHERVLDRLQREQPGRYAQLMAALTRREAS